MKKYIFVILISCLVIVGLHSCNVDAQGTLYVPSGKQELSFTTPRISIEVSSENKGIISIPIYRGDKSGEYEASIHVESTDKATPFKLESKVITFKVGENVSYAKITFESIEDLEATALYDLSLSFAQEDQVAVSGVKKTTLLIKRKLTWGAFAKGTFTSGLFKNSWDVDVEKAQEGEIYRLPNYIEEGYHFVFSVRDDNKILFTVQDSGFVYQGSMVRFGPSLPKSVRNGQNFTFEGKYNLSTGGSFGIFEETLVLK